MRPRVTGAMEGGLVAICRLVMVCAALFVAVSSPAAAAPRAWPEGSTPVATVDGLAQGPLLVDSRIAWLDSSSECVSGCRGAFGDFTERQRYRLRVSRGSGKPRILYTTTRSGGSLGGGADSFGASVDFALSESFLAVVTTSSFDGREDSSFGFRLDAGRRPRSAKQTTLERLASCSNFGISEPDAAFALSGALLVRETDPCRESQDAPSAIALRDLATGDGRSEPLPDDRFLGRIAAAGRFVAASMGKAFDPDDPDAERGHVVALYDRDRPGAIATVPAGKQGPSFDVQPDGRVAICSDDGRLSTFSPSEREPRDLGGCEAGPSIASDRIVFRAHGGDLQVTDLAGRRETIAPLGSLASTRPDFDGRVITYGVPRCVDGDTEILRMPVTARSRVGPFVKCPASIQSGRLTVRGKGRTQFRLGCPRGCSGFFDLVGPRYTIASGSFNRRAGRSTVNVRLDRYGRRVLARSGSLRVKLELTVDNRDGNRRKVTRTLRLTR